MFYVPPPPLDFWPRSTVELLILCLPFGVHWSLLPVGRGCLLIVGHVKCRVCMWRLWMSNCGVDACTFFSVLCACQAFAREQSRIGVMVTGTQHDMHTQHVDMITPQAAPCVLGWSLTTYLKTLSIGAKTTSSNIAPSALDSPPQTPPSTCLSFLSLIWKWVAHCC